MRSANADRVALLGVGLRRHTKPVARSLVQVVKWSSMSSDKVGKDNSRLGPGEDSVKIADPSKAQEKKKRPLTKFRHTFAEPVAAEPAVDD
jgi:hypothetical protein